MALSCEIIAVGTELLLGEIINTDGAYIARKLSEIGIFVYYQTVVGDNPGRLAKALEIARSRADVIITTGGLGPTADDLTKETIAAAFGKKLVRDDASLGYIREFFASRGREMTPNNEKQADMPEGATIFRNYWGTAPACGFEAEGHKVVMLPGPPDECFPLTDKAAIPWLSRFSEGVLVSRYVRIYNVGESAVEYRLRELIDSLENPTLAPYAKGSYVLMRITARAATQEEGLALCLPVEEKLLACYPDNAVPDDGTGLPGILFRLLQKKGKTLATAESCTGGLVSKLMTDLPGVSEVFLGGACVYSNEAKNRVLGVPAEIIAAHGAVSEEVARSLAERARAVYGADYGIGITGIAGPGGGSEEKPVGLVYIAVSGAEKTVCKKNLFGGTLKRTRERIRSDAANTALDMLRALLEE